ncbi:NrdH-redoxin [Companilactobacillus sp. RD055328]|uniref:glutaredoxin-like protein NrdH n=1 Tax=Companilactobacillus sp. RD055328 TaxID=2916634 RepID=UPI001FC8AB51|nr:glutaredoxin-like protein NrdH [Companilactobacillus sp. RD055328]GKQ42445.1 NrdH-redoxin [Companilactobacillus sp. RD055328]
MDNIVVYSKNNCMQCKMTKRYLSEHNVNFQEINVSNEPEAIDYLKGLGYQSVPVVMQNDNDPIVGFRPDALKGLVD